MAQLPVAGAEHADTGERMSVSQQTNDEPESAEFQLPLLGLYADLELGHGSVSLPDEFLRCPAILQLAVIRDWQSGLKTHRLRALRQMMNEMAGTRPELSMAERQAHVDKACASLGIDAAADLEWLARPS
jgi:hypothetical protein